MQTIHVNTCLPTVVGESHRDGAVVDDGCEFTVAAAGGGGEEAVVRVKEDLCGA